MNLDKFVKNGLLELKVIPNAGRTGLKEENGGLRLYVKAVPEKGKANAELIRFFKKEYQLSVRIKSGGSGREKVLEIG